MKSQEHGESEKILRPDEHWDQTHLSGLPRRTPYHCPVGSRVLGSSRTWVRSHFMATIFFWNIWSFSGLPNEYARMKSSELQNIITSATFQNNEAKHNKTHCLQILYHLQIYVPTSVNVFTLPMVLLGFHQCRVEGVHVNEWPTLKWCSTQDHLPRYTCLTSDADIIHCTLVSIYTDQYFHILDIKIHSLPILNYNSIYNCYQGGIPALNPMELVISVKNHSQPGQNLWFDISSNFKPQI